MCFSSVHSKYHHWEVLARAGVNTGVVLDLPWEGSWLPCINSWLCSCSVPPPNPLLSWSREKGESHAPCRLGTYFIKENISSTTSEAKTKKEENPTPWKPQSKYMIFLEENPLTKYQTFKRKSHGSAFDNFSLYSIRIQCVTVLSQIYRNQQIVTAMDFFCLFQSKTSWLVSEPLISAQETDTETSCLKSWEHYLCSCPLFPQLPACFLLKGIIDRLSQTSGRILLRSFKHFGKLGRAYEIGYQKMG